MAGDLKGRGPADAMRVNVNEKWEVEHWTKKFGCTEEQLRAAVRSVGVMAADVEEHLKTSRKPTDAAQSSARREEKGRRAIHSSPKRLFVRPIPACPHL